MSGKNILAAPLAATACALGCLVLLYLKPGGSVAGNRWLILGGSTVTGLAALFLLLPASRPGGGRQALFAPALLLTACLAILLATILVPHPLAKQVGSQTAAAFPVDFNEVFRRFPADPEPGDFRELEWKLIEAERYLARLGQSLNAIGFTTDRQWHWLEAELRGSPFTTLPEPPPHRIEAAPERREQYRRIAQRLLQCADDLDRTARQTRLQPVIDWIEGVTWVVRTRICDL